MAILIQHIKKTCHIHRQLQRSTGLDNVPALHRRVKVSAVRTGRQSLQAPIRPENQIPSFNKCNCKCCRKGYPRPWRSVVDDLFLTKIIT